MNSFLSKLLTLKMEYSALLVRLHHERKMFKEVIFTSEAVRSAQYQVMRSSVWYVI